MRRWIGVALVLSLSACAPAPDSGTKVYLVRHAEKGTGEDPGLTEAGQARAEALARRLVGAGVDRIYSTDYRRTRDTAAPLADALDLDVRLYDARDLDAFATELRTLPGTTLVVGHSNTTPELVQQLSGRPVTMGEDDYGQLYTVRLAPQADFVAGSSTVERFGAPPLR